MFKTELYDEAHSYFASLNPMARRILTDISTTKSIVGDKWQKLNHQDQYDLIMKGFINPILYEKYPLDDNLASDCFPKRNLCTGDKYIVDDEQGPGKQTRRTTWRDEHSGPFSWETQSQMDLSYLGKDAVEETKRILNNPGNKTQAEDGCEKAIMEKPPLPKVPPKRLQSVGDATKNADKEKESSKPSSRNATKSSQEVRPPPRIKPKQPPPDPPTETKSNSNGKETVGNTVIQSSSSEFDNIPKTGFDFLDNW